MIPPRPKPGRKPAGHAPPTKRKAQNREAQRAFRERRAAKVGELEDQLKETEDESRRDRDELKQTVEQLHNDLRHYTNLVSSWQQRYRELEAACARERQLRHNAEVEIQTLRRGLKGGVEAVPLPQRRGARNVYSIEQKEHPAPIQRQNDNTDGVTCGRCTGSTNCQCIEEAFEMAGIAADGDDTSPLKRPHSPAADIEQKRIRQNDVAPMYEHEIDFTAQYASKKPRNNLALASNVPLMAEYEPCDFCKDGDVCICAALATETQQQVAKTGHVHRTIQHMQSPSVNSCTNKPGSCAQCRSNPTSTLFCKTLAATRDSSKAPNITTTLPKSSSTPMGGPTLTCADAFTTLSRHHAFSQASTNFDSWVSQLSAVPGSASAEGKTAFEIEAASVMSVLRFFDKRFGQTPQVGTEDESGAAKSEAQEKYGFLPNGDADSGRLQLNMEDHRFGAREPASKLS